MIVGSLLLILVAVALLVLGLANGSSTLLISSIGASLLAAVALLLGTRQASAGRADMSDDESSARGDAGHDLPSRHGASSRLRKPAGPAQEGGPAGQAGSGVAPAEALRVSASAAVSRGVPVNGAGCGVPSGTVVTADDGAARLIEPPADDEPAALRVEPTETADARPSGPCSPRPTAAEFHP